MSEVKVKAFAWKPEVAAIHRLRVNVKSLTAEARVIRIEERRCGQQYRGDLFSHRTDTLRKETRYALLALTFVRGRRYAEVEAKFLVPVDARRLYEKLKRFNPLVKLKDVHAWLRPTGSVGA